MAVVDPNGTPIDQNNPVYVSPVGIASGGTNYFTIAAGKATATVVSGVPATFYGMAITTVGAGTPVVFDNATAASGAILTAVAASAPIGFAQGVPGMGVSCINGITISGGATNPAMTVFYHS